MPLADAGESARHDDLLHPTVFWIEAHFLNFPKLLPRIVLDRAALESLGLDQSARMFADGWRLGALVATLVGGER